MFRDIPTIDANPKMFNRAIQEFLQKPYSDKSMGLGPKGSVFLGPICDNDPASSVKTTDGIFLCDEYPGAIGTVATHAKIGFSKDIIKISPPWLIDAHDRAVRFTQELEETTKGVFDVYYSCVSSPVNPDEPQIIADPHLDIDYQLLVASIFATNCLPTVISTRPESFDVNNEYQPLDPMQCAVIPVGEMVALPSTVVHAGQIAETDIPNRTFHFWGITLNPEYIDV